MNKSLDIIHKCLLYIENNLRQKITLEMIAKEIGVSKFHLHRMFKGLTDLTLADYINSRKLSSSIDALISTDYRIIDIAFDYGFDYEQNYIRSFKKVFGITPLKARKLNSDIKVVEPININAFTEINDAIFFKPSFVVKQGFNIVGIKYKMLYTDDESLATSHGRDFFYNKKHVIQNIVNPDHYFGYTYWDEGIETYNYYIPAVHVIDMNNIPENMTSVTIPLNKYAVFKLVGFFNPEDIKGSYLDPIMDYMYGKWIVNNGYRTAGNYRFEFIDTSISKNNYCELYLYMPIKANEY